MAMLKTQKSKYEDSPIQIHDIRFMCDTVRADLDANASMLFFKILQWIQHNIACEKFKHDGKYWTYGTYNSFASQFKNFTGRQAKYAITRLRESGYLIVGDFAAGDARMSWYTLGPKGAAIYMDPDWEEYGNYVPEGYVTNEADAAAYSSQKADLIAKADDVLCALNNIDNSDQGDNNNQSGKISNAKQQIQQLKNIVSAMGFPSNVTCQRAILDPDKIVSVKNDPDKIVPIPGRNCPDTRTELPPSSDIMSSININNINIRKNENNTISSERNFATDFVAQNTENKKTEQKHNSVAVAPDDGGVFFDADEAFFDKDTRTSIQPTRKTNQSAVQKIGFDWTTFKFTGITEQHLTDWKEAFPAVDIPVELKRAELWLKTNPEKKKRQIERFIVNWLNRNQERGGSTPSNRLGFFPNDELKSERAKRIKGDYVRPSGPNAEVDEEMRRCNEAGPF